MDNHYNHWAIILTVVSQTIFLSRITGLDPAAPLYLKWSYDAIRKTDAPFVDVIHTNGERLGEAWARWADTLFVIIRDYNQYNSINIKLS